VGGNGGCNNTLNQVSELHIGKFVFDHVSGSPVIEIEYIHIFLIVWYLKRFLWRHRNKLGWHHELLNSRGLVLKVDIFEGEILFY
jgi:hypothetical protein